jgi:predicted metal-dependent HD superfamily phosphohydrolase
MASLKASWDRAWAHLSLQGDTDQFDRLIKAYDEPHRSYHTRQHLEECIGHFSGVVDVATHPGEIEIALWFHDAVYDLHGPDNERRSAEWALQALTQAGATDPVKARVHALIMATLHSAVPTEADQQLLVDIDLAILGATPARFKEYDRQVAMEYSWVPSDVYTVKRREVLSSFLARPHIYSTDHFRAEFEAQARINLRNTMTPQNPQPCRLGHLFTDALPPAEGERFDELLRHRNLVVERIVSSARLSHTQYVQTQDEWVLLVHGEATLTVAGQRLEIKAGDHVFLPAGTPHTVEQASEGALWLAVHLHPA